MNRSGWKLCSWAMALALCLPATARVAGAPKQQPMTEQAYEAAKRKIAADLEADRKTCGTAKGLVREVCRTKAKGKAEAARAELEAHYRPSPEATQKAKNVVAEANYEVARKTCQAKKGDARDRCVEQARLAREAAIRQAKVEKVEATGGPFGGAAATKKSDQAAGKS